MRRAWNKGLTKTTNTSVSKISKTMRARKIDNFKEWRNEARRTGRMKSSYPEFCKNGDLAELIGVVLGDGNIHAFPRTECLRIVGNSSNSAFIRRYACLVEAVVGKKPAVRKRTSSNATDIVVYEKYLSRRLGIPTGARARITIRVPAWIRSDRACCIRYLRGLYEAEGSIHFHPGTYTHKLLFENTNQSMRAVVMRLLKKLGFHPHTSGTKIQISRKDEVQKLKNLLQFRTYD